MLRVIETGKNPTMRYLHRTHRVSVAWLHERFKGKVDLDIVYEKSDNMCADIYTKAFTDKVKWQQVCRLINIINPTAFLDLFQSKVLGDTTSSGEPSPSSVTALHKTAVHDLTRLPCTSRQGCSAGGVFFLFFFLSSWPKARIREHDLTELPCKTRQCRRA